VGGISTKELAGEGEGNPVILDRVPQSHAGSCFILLSRAKTTLYHRDEGYSLTEPTVTPASSSSSFPFSWLWVASGQRSASATLYLFSEDRSSRAHCHEPAENWYKIQYKIEFPLVGEVIYLTEAGRPL
jgi:hypothetical protein